MTERTRKILYWVFKVFSVFISCALPIWAVCEKFPIWMRRYDAEYSVGVGLILILLVLVIVFRRTVFDFLHDKFNLKHAPPITVWFVMLISAYILVYLGRVMTDMTTVFWMGLIGCAVGNIATYIAENHFAKKVNDDGRV